MNVVECVLALEPELPPLQAMYGYVVAGNGTFIRGGDERLVALVPTAPARHTGLAEVTPYARLLVPRIPELWLASIHHSAVAQLPREAMYQLVPDAQARNSLGGWACARPAQASSRAAVTFQDTGQAVVDLHSHNSMDAFFSRTDDGDEQGLRFYCVIGRLDTDRPEIAARVGVYGHHLAVPATVIFDGLGPFVDVYGRDENGEPNDGEDA